MSSSDEFSVATPDETTGKDTEFSLVGSFRNKYMQSVILLHINHETSLINTTYEPE